MPTCTILGKNWLLWNNMKRFFAILGLICIILCVLATLTAAIFGAPTKVLFFFIFLDVAIPAVIYACMLIDKYLKARDK